MSTFPATSSAPPAEPHVTSGLTYTIVSGSALDRQPRYSREDSGFTATKYAFAIEKSHPFVAIWNSTLEDRVMGIVRSNDDWRSVNVLRRGWSMHAIDNPPVVFITVVKEASSPEWRRMALAIYEMCAR
jgi:hypothetical protein